MIGHLNATQIADSRSDSKHFGAARKRWLTKATTTICLQERMSVSKSRNNNDRFTRMVGGQQKRNQQQSFFPDQHTADMRFVQNFTLPNFQAKNFTLSISPNFNSFSKKKHKK